ncbi:MAG: pilus assembly protein TadG-related protein, partial [Planctomycetaceae bacterium]
MRTWQTTARRRRCERYGVERRGTVAILAAMMLVFLMGMAAFAVDLAYLGLVREQMQTAADAAALAASDELVNTWEAEETQVASALETARNIAAITAMSNRMSGKPGTFIDGDRDLRFGARLWDSQLGDYVESWGQPPYNLVEVTVRRTESSDRLDGVVPLFFARALGREHAGLQTTSVVALSPGAGFRIDENFSGTLPILPIACDEDTWNSHWNWSSEQASSSGDLT